MALNVQTAGDEAIYIKFPGASGKPTPASGRSIPSLVDGSKELRTIKDSSGKVIWAHKWRLKISGEHLSSVTFTKGSLTDPDIEVNNPSDPLGTQPFARCKDGKYIIAEVEPDRTSGYVFEKWSDGNTDNPRMFFMDRHLSYVAQMKLGFEVTIKALSTSGTIYKAFVESGSTINLSNLKIDAGNKAVLDTLEEFTALYVDDDHINLKDSGFRGWKLDALKGTMDGVAVEMSVDKDIVITGTTVVACSWTKQVCNKYLKTSSAINNPGLTKNFFLFSIASKDDVALPTGGRLYISEAYGILTHMGNATSHPMCIFASVNDITETDDTDYSRVGAGKNTQHKETKWMLPQKLDFGSYTSFRYDYNASETSYTTLNLSLKAHDSTAYNEGKSWDILASSKFRPFAPRKTPFSYIDWYSYVTAKTRFEPSITTASALSAYVTEHADQYEDWSTLRTIFTMRSTVFSTREDVEGHIVDCTLQDHMAMINAGTYRQLAETTVIDLNMAVYISDNFGHDKESLYILDPCSEDFTKKIPSGTIDQSFYDYFNHEGHTFPGVNRRICINDPDDPENIIEIYSEYSEDKESKFESHKIYYLRFDDLDTEKTMTFYIPMSGTSATDYVYPIYAGETITEYKQRVAEYAKTTVADTGIALFEQDPSSSSPDAIYVKKSTGDDNIGVAVYAKQTSGGLSIPEKLGSGNKPTGLHITMLKSNEGCTVPWKFFLYSLKINLY